MSRNHVADRDTCPCQESLTFEQKFEVEFGLADYCRCVPGTCAVFEDGGPADVPWGAVARVLVAALRDGVLASVPRAPVPRGLRDDVVVARELAARYAELGDEVGRAEWEQMAEVAAGVVLSAGSGVVPFVGRVAAGALGEQLLGLVWGRSCCSEVVAEAGPLRVRRVGAAGEWEVVLVVGSCLGNVAVGPVRFVVSEEAYGRQGLGS